MTSFNGAAGAPHRLVLEASLTPPRLAEIGRPTGAFPRDDGSVVALCSEFPLLFWPGRAVYEGHRLRYRVGLYHGDLADRIAVFDGARYPINDVALHPLKPLAAVATGSYDGGWMFEGDLWLWNWETGEIASLLGESRAVVRCRFTDAGGIAVLLRPRDEEGLGGVGGDPFETFFGLVIDDLRDAAGAGYGSRGGKPDPRLAGLSPCSPADLGFPGPQPGVEDRRRDFDRAVGHLPEFEERARVWDVLWVSADRIALVHDNCRVEVRSTAGERVRLHRGAGAGIQLLRSPDGPLVNVLERGNPFAEIPDRSTLFRLTPDGLEKLVAFERAVVVSVDLAGHLLCRDPGDPMGEAARRDRLMTRDLKEVLATDLGHYDCFNHYLRLDGGDGLYFLCGTPRSSHRRKRLCRLDPAGAVTEMMRWDDQGGHLMNGVGCLAPDGTLIRGYRVYDPKPGKGVVQIQRCDIASGRPLWTIDVAAPVTAMALVGDARLAYALTDGTLGLTDIAEGRALYEEPLAADGVATVAMSLDANGERLAAGTVDGRLLLYRLG